jgi:NAD dependent epimerase/dehydratase
VHTHGDLSNKRVLVTGADGFIGSHLVEMLVEQGARVRALAYYNSFNNWGWLEDIACLDKVEVVTGDVRDPHFCKVLTKDIDIVFHLAALIAIPYSYVAPDSYIDTNVKGTLNICQAARENGCSRIIQTSTSEVYGSARYVPIDEKHPLQPQSPYSASKIGADAIAMSFFYAFNLPVTIARPFNTYGPRQSARAVIPTMIAQIAAGKRRVSLGDVTTTRDFNYVKDTCRGFIALACCPEAIGQTINIGSGTEISIGETFNLIRKLMHSEAEILTEDARKRPENSEVLRLCCDNTKIKTLAGFSSAYSFDKGLAETIAWFTQERNLSKYKVNLYNV